jgi:SAM-dependent methyltransferase
MNENQLPPNSSRRPAHAAVYGAPALYDLAFGYRDYARECDFLRRACDMLRDQPPRSFLELAAGPARHALEMAAAGVRAAALDLSPEMAAYGAAKAGERGLTLPYLVADMTSFAHPDTFDLVASMLCSATYLLTDDAFVAHLDRVHAVLVDGGLYVMELVDPSDRKKAKSTWTARDAAGELDVRWLDEETPDSRILRTRVRLEYKPFDGSPPTLVEDEALQRFYGLTDIEALIARRAHFEIAGLFGALDEGVPLDDEAAWRMLVVLRKRSDH